MLPRVSFNFIVKSDIELFVWSVVKGRISISSVGAGASLQRVADCPSSLRLQIALLSVAETNDIHLAGRGRRPRRPEVITVTK